MNKQHQQNYHQPKTPCGRWWRGFKYVLLPKSSPPDSSGVIKHKKMFSSHGGFLTYHAYTIYHHRVINQIKLTYCDETKEIALHSQTVHLVNSQKGKSKTNIRQQPTDHSFKSESSLSLRHDQPLLN